MKGKVALVTGPSEDPITLDEAKAFLKVDTEDDDGLILSQITAAKEYAENVQGRKFMNQTWRYYLDGWPEDDWIELPFSPLQSIISLKYTDYNGTETTISSTCYDADTVSEPGRLVLAYGETWPITTLDTLNPIVIQFTCGYGTPDDIPETTKAAMKLIIDELYENRETVILGQNVSKLDIVNNLLSQNRTFDF